ncbi:flavin reductase family protein [Acrocarpospora macrocephala]|uniref:Monooxygenase n=1 Tax=Acrocarpospora macrocephala TaxID=150177 RepID=A0A5M3WXP7_9ACTN|nr:flavin reductase family protein [Acrocarpospora macrocephala]GES14247.1 monooxygenase [Acrocarpospora macrocephala]
MVQTAAIIEGTGPSLHDQSVDGARFRQALAAHASGVVVITAQVDGAPVGLTVTSFTSVSLTPPLVSFYVDRASTTWPSLKLADYFAVNVLADEQTELAEIFARRGIDRFANCPGWRIGAYGVPLLAGISARLTCHRHSVADIGDHILVVGHVVETGTTGGKPLLYHRASFGSFVPHPRESE